MCLQREGEYYKRGMKLGERGERNVRICRKTIEREKWQSSRDERKEREIGFRETR